MIIDDLSDF